MARPTLPTPGQTNAWGTTLNDAVNDVSDRADAAATAPVDASRLPDLSGTYAPATYPVGAAADGVTDDTATIQAAIDGCPAGGVVDGHGNTFCVTAVFLKSDMEFRNFNLIALAPGTNLTAPVTIDGDAAYRENITIRNVHIDGNRGNQDGTIEGPEDGGRHGFRFLGRIENLLMQDSSASYCAGDGIELFSSQGIDAQYNQGTMRHMLFERCSFTFNRRHGMSMDSADDIKWVDCKFNDNGGDVAGTGSGHLGHLLNGSTYGSAFDLEEYGLKTYCADIHFVRCEGLRNQRYALAYGSTVAANDPNFVIRSGFRFEGGHFDKGVGPLADDSVIQFSPDDDTLGTFYDDVQFSGVRLDGSLSLHAIGSARQIGGTTEVAPTGYIGTLDHVVSMTVVGVARGTGRYYLDTSSVSYVEDKPLWLPAASLSSVSQNAVPSLINRQTCWLLNDNEYDGVSGVVTTPDDWELVDVDLLWANDSTATGDIIFAPSLGGLEVGSALAVPSSYAAVTVTAGAQNIVTQTRLLSSVAIPSRHLTVEVLRDGVSAPDTLVGNAVILGFIVTRAQ